MGFSVRQIDDKATLVGKVDIDLLELPVDDAVLVLVDDFVVVLSGEDGAPGQAFLIIDIIINYYCPLTEKL